MQREFIVQSVGSRNLSQADLRKIRSVSRRVGAATRRERKTKSQPEVPNDPSRGEDSTGTLHPEITTTSCIEKGDRDVLTDPRYSASVVRAPSSYGRFVPPELAVLVQPGLSTHLLRRAAAAERVSSDPKRWVKTLSLMQDSVLHVLPRSYGHSLCLDNAIECVAQRIWLCFTDETKESGAMIEYKYGRALRSLNTALTSTDGLDSTVWYATSMLALFELLDHSSQHNWILHAKGAFDVLDALGPESIKTEAEKDLLVAQSEVMILESTFSNLDCFLSRPKWQKALASTMTPGNDFSSRSEAVVTLWMMTGHAPGLFRRVTGVVIEPSQHRLERKEEIAKGLRGLVDNLATWAARWNTTYKPPDDRDVETPAPLPSTGQAPSQKTAALATCLAYYALGNRFLAALDTSSATVTEPAAVEAALCVEEYAGSRELDSVPALGMRMARKMARSILATTAQWSGSEGQPPSHPSVTIDPGIFISWCASFGRVT